MNEYLIIGLKTLLFLAIILIIIRIMGKRELGELNVFDVIISFMISEIFSNAIADPKSNLLLALLPIIIIFIVQILISFVVLKSKKIRYLIESKPSLIIDNGRIDYDEMKKQRYNISDLLQQVRSKDIDSLDSIAYAILENNGQLSIIKKEDSKLYFPLPIISDGSIDQEVKERLKISDDWIEKELAMVQVDDLKDIFMGFIDKDKHLFIISEKSNNFKNHK